MSDEKRTWYKRTHQFTPYTKADGTAVSDEFDAIQASFERIPEMRDDGKGFAVSPLIPKPTDKNHPVTFGMLTESETSVNNARDDVTEKARQVAANTQAVAKNTQTTAENTHSAQQSATAALSSRQSAENAENMARKWASNPVDHVVAEGKYSAYHYATKAAQSAHNLSVAEQSARENAQLATQKAEEVKQDVNDVTQKAEQVARNTTSVDENTRLAVNCANQAKQSAGSAQDNREKTENALALTQKYATQAATSAQNLSVAEQSAQNYANIAVEKANIAIQKALEAVQAAEQAASIAGGEVEYSKLLNVPRADTNTTGVTRLTNDTGLDSEQLGLTAKAGKSLSQAIAALRLSVNSLPKKSDSVNSNSSNTVASSAAVKAAYDKGVEAKNTAESAVSIVNEAKSSLEASGQALITAFQNQVNNNTKNIADKFNQSVSGRVSKSGDTMTGRLTVPHIVVNDPSNNNNSVQIGDDAKFLDVDIGDTIGLQGLFAPDKGYIAYGTNKKRFGYDGSRFVAESSIFTDQYGQGSYAGQYTSGAPFMVEEVGSVDRDTYHPFIKGRVRRNMSYGAAISFGYTTRQGDGDGFGRGIVHLIEDNGSNRIWTFEHNGNFHASGDVVTGNGISLNAINSQAVKDIRLGALVERTTKEKENWNSYGNGYVVTGYDVKLPWFVGNQVYLRPIQKFVNNQWITIANS